MRQTYSTNIERERRLIFEGGAPAAAPESSPALQEIRVEAGKTEKLSLQVSPNRVAAATNQRIQQADKTPAELLQKTYSDKNAHELMARGGAGAAKLTGKLSDFLGTVSGKAQEYRKYFNKGSAGDTVLGGVSDLSLEGARATNGISKSADGFAKKELTEAEKAKKIIDDAKGVIAKNEGTGTGKPAEGAAVTQKETKVAKPSEAVTKEANAAVKANEVVKDKPSNATKEAGKEGTKESAEKPQTNKERLTGEMNSALKDLKESKNAGESIVALGKMIAIMAEYIKSAFKGTLNKTPEKTDSKSDAKEGQSKQEDADARTRVRKELVEREKKTQSKKPGEDMDKLQAEKKEQVEKNTDAIKNCDTRISDIKQEDSKLIESQSQIQKQIEGLRGDSKNQAQISTLQIEADRISDQLQVNHNAIDRLEKNRDDLTAKNKELNDDIKAIDDVKKDLNDAFKELGPILAELLQTLKDKLPNVSANIEMTPLGLRPTLDGLSGKELQQAQPYIESTNPNGGVVLKAGRDIIINTVQAEQVPPAGKKPPQGAAPKNN